VSADQPTDNPENETAVVVDGQASVIPNPASVSKTGLRNVLSRLAPSRLFSSKKVRVGSLLLAVVLAGGIGTAFFMKKKNEPAAVCTNPTNVQLLKEAAHNLAPNKNQELKKSVDKIKTLKDYEKDPNCLNPIVTYYANIGDSKNASLYMTKLNEKYDASKGFDKSISNSAPTIEQLRTVTENIKGSNGSKQSGNTSPDILRTTNGYGRLAPAQ
jgi:hypothetical protein